MQAISLLAATMALVVAAGSATGQVPGFGKLPPFNELNETAPRATSVAAVPVASPKPTWTRHPDFFIRFDIAESSSEQPTEVRLYLSSDQGKNWTLYQQQRPDAGRFQFSAQSDGQYWFAVRTSDARGQLIAHRGWAPEMVVIVDRQQPRLELNVDVDSVGQVTARWIAEDPHLAADTFALSYQDRQGGSKNVELRPAEASGAQQRWDGKAEWWLQPDGSEVLVRAEVADKAGNSASAEQRISLTPTAQAASSGHLVSNARLRPTETGPLPSEDPLGQHVGRWNDTFGKLPEQFPPWRNGETPGSKQQAPIASSIAAPVSNRFTPATPAPELPRNDRPPFTASPNFELDYDLLDVGPRGARAVELWYTRDRGRTWAKYGPDMDAKSPVQVRLDDEGIYGFSLVVHGYDAPAPRPPQDGEPPDFLIGVDWTKPTARIMGARFGAGANKSTMTIEWLAEDALLADRPISLSYRASPQDNWKLIAADLPNSQPYFQWHITPPVPPQIYVRLEVRDLAGNVSTDQLVEPVTRQGQSAKGRIRQFREIGTPRQSSYRPWSTR